MSKIENLKELDDTFDPTLLDKNFSLYFPFNSQKN